MVVVTSSPQVFIFILIFQICWCEEYNKGTDGPISCPDIVVGRQITDLQIKPYVTTTTALPHDAFQGDQYTVSLSLPSSTTKCWFKFDPLTYTLVLLVDREVIQSQPSGGYVFRLTAVSDCNHKEVHQTFRMRVLTTKHVSCMDIQVDVQLNNPDPHACALEVMNDVILRTETYLSHSLSSQQVVCTLQEYTLHADGYLRFVIGFMMEKQSQCLRLCTQNFFGLYAQRIVDRYGEVNADFERILGSVYTVHSAHASIGCRPPPATQHPPTSKISTLPTTGCPKPSISSGAKNIYLDAPYRPHIIALPPNIFHNQQDLVLTLHAVDNQNANGRADCWVRFTSPNIYFFPTNDTVARKPRQGYRFQLTATNQCGSTNSALFTVDIKRVDVAPCFVFEAVFNHPLNLCEEILLKEFYDALRWSIDFAQYGELFVTHIHTKDLQRSAVKFIITKQNQNGRCSDCKKEVLVKLKNLFSEQNLRKLFKKSNIISNVENSRYMETASQCKGTTCEEKQAISLTARAGIVNDLVLPASVRGYTLSTKDLTDQHFCLLQNSEGVQTSTLMFLPPLQSSKQYGIRNDVIELVKTNQNACPIKINIHTSPLSQPPCFHITLKFITVKSFPCPLKAISEMVKILAEFYRVQTQQIVIQQYSTKPIQGSSTKENFEIVLVFSFTEQVVECSKCAPVLINSFIAQIMDRTYSVTKVFQSVISGQFKFVNISYVAASHGALTSVIDVIDGGDSFIPLWVYFIPLFFLLLLLLLLLLTCCCMCCGGNARDTRRNRASSIFSYWSSCCMCCYPRATNGVKRRNHQRVHSTASYPSVYDVSRTAGGSSAYTSRGGSTEMSSLTKHQSLDSVNNPSTKGVTGTASTSAINNTTKESVRIPIVEATPCHGEQNTKVTYAQVYKNKGKQSDTHLLKQEDGEPYYVPPNTYDRGLTKEGHQSTSEGISSHTINRGRNTARKSIHRRSYSDGFLLDEDYLDLPTPPTAPRCRDGRLSRRDRYSRRLSHRYCHDDMSVRNSKCGKEKIQISIPVKITARVKSISKSLDNGLDTIRPSYVRFTEPEDWKNTPESATRRTYHSKTVSFEKDTPLSEKYPASSSCKFTTTTDEAVKNSDNDGFFSTVYKRNQSRDSDPWNDISSIKKKTVEKRSTKTATSSKRYPWQDDDLWKKRTASSVKESTDVSPSAYTWRVNGGGGSDSTKDSHRKSVLTSPGNTTSRKYVKISGTSDMFSEV